MGAPLDFPVAMKTIRCLLAALAATLAFAAFAADVPLPAGVTRVTSVEGITEYDLANGLRVLFAPDNSKPTTTVNTTYMVGSRHENYGETGMAHLLEHLLFKGTPTYPQAWVEFTKRGLRANGSTWTDRTNYFASMAANEENLEWYLKWSADAMTHSFIAKKDLDSEMTVVRNEMESGENNPSRSLLFQTIGASYVWHSYGKSTIGARADVENVSIERLQAFYRNFYQPDNAVLIVTGKFDEAKTLAIVAREFGRIPRPARKLLPTYTVDPEQQGERTITLRRAGDTQIVMAVYHMPAGASPEYAHVELLSEIFAAHPAGRLYKALVETKQAAEVFGFGFEWKEPTVLIFGAQMPGSASLETARATLVRTLDAVDREPITEAEVERARTKYLKEFERTTSDPEKIGVALSTSIAMGDWRLFFLQRDQVRNARAADVQRTASAYLVPDNRTLGVFIPTANPKRPPKPVLVDAAPLVKDYKGDAAVAQGEAFEATPENIDRRTERAQLASGMKVALLPKRTRAAAVNVRLVLHLGDEKSLAGTPPVGGLTAAMLNRGAAGMSRQDIEDAFDKLKARVTITGDNAAVAVNAETTRENLPEVMRLIAKVLREPTFPAAELDQLKNARVTEIEAQRKEPNAISRMLLARHGNPYPKGHVRYEPTFDESIADINAATVERLRAFHSTFYGVDSADFAAVGDFDAPALKAQLEALFAGWKARTPYQRVANPIFALTATGQKVETPDKANAFFMTIARIPLRDDDPDYPAFLVANHIFGGGTGGIVWKRIREKEGISYGINSGMNANSFEPHTTWTTAAIYAPQNLERLQKAFAEEIGRVVKDGFTAGELRDAKAGLLAQRRLARAQDAGLANSLAFYLELGRTMEYQAKVDRAIESVTLEQANAAFRKYIDPAKLATVYAGDFAKAAK
jgi:zinc protease